MKKSAGFAIDLSTQYMIEANAEQIYRADKPRHWLLAGWVDEKGRITKKGWTVLNKDIGQVERNVVALLRKKFEGARDEGHVDDALVGTVWFDTTKPAQVTLIDEMVDGKELDDFGTAAWAGTSRFSVVIGGRLDAFDIEDA